MSKLISCFALMLLSIQCFASIPYHPISFPRDFGSHHANTPYKLDSNMMEWWYFNGKIKTEKGRNFGYHAVFFNYVSQDQDYKINPILHIQVADLDNKKSYAIQVSLPLEDVELSTTKMDIKAKDHFTLSQEIIDGKSTYHLWAKAEGPDAEVELNFNMQQKSDVVLANLKTGYFSLPENKSSYYYYIPDIATSGSLTLNGNKYTIAKASGSSWMDRQWGDFNVDKFGWNWFSVRLSNNLFANIFLYYDFNKKSVFDGYATVILPTNEVKYISYKDIEVKPSEYWENSNSNVSYPMKFDINIPKLELKITNRALFPEQELLGYWEGYCNVTATYKGKRLEGYSFTELVMTDPVKNNQPNSNFLDLLPSENPFERLMINLEI